MFIKFKKKMHYYTLKIKKKHTDIADHKGIFTVE